MSEGWEGTNYPKGKERAFQTKGRENAKALWQKKSGMFQALLEPNEVGKNGMRFGQSGKEGPDLVGSCGPWSREGFYSNFQKILLHLQFKTASL